MDWDAFSKFALLSVPPLLAVALTIAVKRINADDSSEDTSEDR